MGREASRKRERRQHKGAASKRDAVIDLLETASLINRHLTESLCQEVFRNARYRERERIWTLHTLLRFWTHVVLKSPGSLTQAFEDALRDSTGGWPAVEGSLQGFFNRSKTLKWTFPAQVYRQYVTSIASEAPATFAAEFTFLRKHFPEVLIVDGSRLDAVAHRLKMLWDVRSKILPGCLIACYDMFRGYPRILGFDPDAARAEMHRVREILDDVLKETLLLGDRLYASVALFEEMGKRGIWGLFRLNGLLKIRKLRCMSRRRVAGGTLEEWEVEAGSGATAPRQHLRYIRMRRGRITYELLTNVMDSTKLSARTAMALYPRRWNVERMFFDLKEVLNLHRFYAANPNAVALQVYAAAIIYTAMRIAQAHVAQQAGVKPEEISPAKFFPRMADACRTLSGIDLGYKLTCLENRGRRLRPPNPRGRPELTTTLKAIRVQRRKGKRRKRRYCEGRRRWKSFAHIPGGKQLIRN